MKIGGDFQLSLLSYSSEEHIREEMKTYHIDSWDEPFWNFKADSIEAHYCPNNCNDCVEHTICPPSRPRLNSLMISFPNSTDWDKLAKTIEYELKQINNSGWDNTSIFPNHARGFHLFIHKIAQLIFWNTSMPSLRARGMNYEYKLEQTDKEIIFS